MLRQLGLADMKLPKSANTIASNFFAKQFIPEQEKVTGEADLNTAMFSLAPDDKKGESQQ